MAVLSKTLADFQTALGYGSVARSFDLLFLQIVPPNGYALVHSLSDGHLEVWSVTP